MQNDANGSQWGFDIGGGATMTLNKSLGISVDLVTLGCLPEKFRDQVLNEAKPL